MNRPILIAYQLVTGLSDSSTGALFLATPELTLQLLHLRAAPDALVYVSFIGAFVLSVGFACLYGTLLAYRARDKTKLATIWLLTGITRASVAIFVIEQVLVSSLHAGWLLLALFDGICVIIQAVGLREDWLSYAVR